MSPGPSGRLTGLVLAAGGSSRLGRPKQLLPYGDAILLEHVLETARACGMHQIVCVIGGAAAAVREAVDLAGVEGVNLRWWRSCGSRAAARREPVLQEGCGHESMHVKGF